MNLEFGKIKKIKKLGREQGKYACISGRCSSIILNCAQAAQWLE
jgi:hypothetical protein